MSDNRIKTLDDLDWEDVHQRDAARIAALEAENARLLESRNFWKGASDQNLGFMNQEADYRKIERQNAKLVIAVKDVRIADLESENAAMRQALDFIRTSLSPAASFVATDVPDPPQRPDGTLAPAPKPLRLSGDAGPQRMVGP